MQVTLTGGEPLCHPEFFDILEKACLLFPNVMILSNGALMNDGVIARLHNFNILSVSVSVHGDKETHEYLTGVKGSYDCSLRAIRRFLDRGVIPVASNYVLNAANTKQLKSTIHELSSIGLKFMTITRFVPTGIGKSAADLALKHNELVGAFQVVHEHLQTNAPPHIEVAEATPFCAVPKHLKYLANTCSYGYDRFYVDVEGNLMVCGLSRTQMGGNVLERPISEIKASSSVFRMYLQDAHAPVECTSCNEFDLCHGGCRAAALENGTWIGGRDCHMVTPSSPK